MSGIHVSTIIPSSLIPRPLQSGSQHIIRKRQVEVLPVSQTTYQHGGNDRIVFNISSANEFLDAQNSYLRFEFRAYGITSAGVDDLFLSLATGGAHALFREVILRLQNGVEIARIQDYDKWYAMMSMVNESREHVDSYGWMYGDSVGRYKQFDPLQVKHTHTGSFESANLRYGGLVTAGAVANTHRIPPLIPENVDTRGGLEAAGAAALAVTALGARSGGYNAARVQACDNANNVAALTTTGKVLCMTIPLSLLTTNQYLPLAFVQGGLQLEFVLQNPIYSLCLNENVTPSADASALNYSISTPRFVTTMVQPSEEIQAQYLNLYRAGKLQYPFTQVQTFLNTNSGANGSFSFQMHPNRRSAILAMSIAQNLNANTTARSVDAFNNAYIYDSTGKLLKMGISSYQYKVGSDLYPDIAVNCSDNYDAEAFLQSQKAFNHLNSVAFTPRAAPSDWWAIHTDSGKATADETKCFIMTTDLSRDGSIFSGVDISIAPFILECGTSAAYQLSAADAIRYVRTFLFSNAILKISQDGVSIVC